MVGWIPLLSQVVPFLLVCNRGGHVSHSSIRSSRASFLKSTATDSTTTTTTTTTIPTTTELRSPTDLSSSFAQLYRVLERLPADARFFRTSKISDSIRFVRVTPPLENGTSTWRRPEDFFSLNDDDSNSDRVAINSLWKNNQKKPLAVYIPGLDGYGISAATNQFDDLAQNFDVWRMTVLPQDRSTFGQILSAITKFINELHETGGPDREIVLIGESCGGVLSLATAYKLYSDQQEQQRQNEKKTVPTLKGLVLVNPATSFDRTAWDRLIPLVSSLQYFENDASTNMTKRAEQGDSLSNDVHHEATLTPYSVLGSLILSGIIPDNDQLRRIVDTILNLPDLDIPPSNIQQIQKVFQATTDAFAETGYRLPADTLRHRVMNWLVVATPIVNSRLESSNASATSFRRQMPQTLLVVGKEDKLLPSAAEADRIVNLLDGKDGKRAEKLVVQNRGHFVLDQNVNLTEAILYSKIFYSDEKKKQYDAVLDWKSPTPDRIKKMVKDEGSTVAGQRNLHSPIFFSTDARGKRWRGLSKVPSKQAVDGRPILFVANHQFAALDLRLLVAELYEQRNLLPRGLAHPVTFEAFKDQPPELQGRFAGLVDQPNFFNLDFVEFGAIKVNPRNYYRLMQTGQDALLFPGGAKEALSGRTDYPLFWPNGGKVDFVRTAARFNATIVPVSAIGMIDSVSVLAEPQQLVNLPIIGERMKQFNANMSAARYDETTELIGFPLAIPKLPARNYFLFGSAVDTSGLDPNDKEACANVYKQIESQVRTGLDDLVRARQQDPFADTPRRLAYERVFGKQAPTFSVDKLNRL